MRRIGFLSVALAAAVTMACNSNRNAANDTSAGSAAVGTAGKSDVSRGDKDFVHDVAIMNMAEIDLGRLAADRAADPEVKKFAQMMVDEHTKAGDTLKTLASQQNIEVPAEVDKKHQDLREKLAGKQGLDFDREYMDAMVDGHNDFIDKLESRIDKTRLSEWKSKWTDRTTAQKGEAATKAETVYPEKSDNTVTMAINQWAADTYPVAYAHRENAKTLQNTLKRRTTD